MKTITKAVSLILSLTVIVSACKKEFDTPPLKAVNEGAKVFISQIKPRVPSAGKNFKFAAGDSSLYCTVIADETSGNIYKQIFVRDEVGSAIQVNLVNSGGLYVGDRLRINMNNLYAINANNMIYLDSVDVEKSVVKLSSGNTVNPTVISLSSALSQTNPLNAASLQSQLVQITGVEFVPNATISTIGDPISKSSVNQTIKDCNSSKTLIVRSSGYANFASKPLPKGNGVITAVLTQYNGDMQLTIRNYAEINMNGTLCGGAPTPTSPTTATFVIGSPVTSINETFSNVSDNVVFSSSGWINFNEAGSVKWKGDVVSTTYKSIYASAYGSKETNNTMWLITPPVIYSSTKTLSFKSGFGFWKAGHQNALKAYVSTNFDGKNFSTANWTAISSATYPDGTPTNGYYTGSAGLISSGTINLKTISILSGYSGNFFIAWKYVGSDPNFTSNIYLDDIIVQ
jgi:hypothetical protein